MLRSRQSAATPLTIRTGVEGLPEHGGPAKETRRVCQLAATHLSLAGRIDIVERTFAAGELSALQLSTLRLRLSLIPADRAYC